MTKDVLFILLDSPTAFHDWKYSMRKLFAVLAIAAFGFIGCHSSAVEPVPPIEADNPSIVMEVSGGFWGVYRRMSIDADGLATNENVYPVLHLQLSREERDTILALLEGFENYNDSYPSLGADTYHFKITLKTATKEKSVDIDQYAFENTPGIAQLYAVILKLAQVEVRVFQETSPWLGLQYTLGLDKQSYKPGETITIICHVTNTTPLLRILYFRNNYRMQFGFSSMSYNPHISAWIPDYSMAWRDYSAPSQESFAPGESRDITVQFDQAFINTSTILGESYTALPIGAYAGTIYLLAGADARGGYWGAHNISFQVAY